MGQRFFAGTRYAAALSPSHEDMRDAIGAVFKHGRVWVAEVDGLPRGFLAAILQPVWFSPGTIVALETAWWMDADVRGRVEGVRLLLEFERWAKEQGAQAICMSDIAIEGESAAERILTRLGYRITERTFTKGL
jgi:hypothetical protein